ncbi:HD domain-containing protein [Acholeplasma granularum]|uniref:HD domain-containing protein n=1 Tax=Acholeplasma granularum TaxID=264635 RepID=UPI0004711CA6|nr:HD domain-containing protein [Acholeplasma granularum]
MIIDNNIFNKKHKSLIDYCVKSIIPNYSKLDKAHQIDHVYEVINKSFDIAKDYDVKLDLVYIVAVYHDLGLLIDRKTHHIEGGKILFEDEFIKKHYSITERNIMKEAIEDHRASSKYEPRSIYGKIISEADRLIEPKTIIIRSFYYQMSMESNHEFDNLYPKVYAHLVEKYGKTGYLKLWLEVDSTLKTLNDFQEQIENSELIKAICLKIYNEHILRIL